VSDEQHGRLSGLQAAALVVGSMVGAGVFTTSGFLLADLGSRLAVLLVWVIAGGVALAGAAVYGELGAMLPRVGGEYVYLSRAFHPLVGFLAGFVSLVAGFAAPMAAGASAFGEYLEAAWPGAPGRLAGCALLVLVTALHARDVTGAGRAQTLVTGFNVAAIVVFVVVVGVAVAVGAGVGAGAPVPAPAAALAAPSPGAFAVGLVFVSYAYFGWNAAAYVAGELREPQRTLPRVLVAGCALVTLLYVALNAVMLAAVPNGADVGRVDIAHLAAAQVLGETAARPLSAMIALVQAGSVSALAMTGARVAVAMAEDGLFFRALGRRNRAGAPTAAVLCQGALALALALTATFESLLIYVGFTLSLSAAATVVGALVLRRRQPAAARPFRTPGWPVVPLLFVGLSIWIAAHAVAERPRESLAGAATLALGALLYQLWRRRQ
jgi:basic amino acid/polyamine antiporter, APA family